MPDLPLRLRNVNVPESGLNPPQVDPVLKKAVLGLKAGQVSQPIEVRDREGISFRILKLISRESPGQRALSGWLCHRHVPPPFV